MTDLLDRAVKSAMQDFFNAAPERSDTPLEPAHRSPRSPSRTTLVAAATVVVVGVGGLLAVRLGDDPAGSGAATTPESTTLETTGSTVMVTAQTYVVQSGDYLANIAERHCVTMEEIAGYNNWSDGASHPLFPDQVIQIPPGACGGQAVNDGVAMVPTLFPTVPDSENSEVLPPSGGFAQVSYDNAPVMRGLIGRRDGDAIVEAFTLTAGPWLNPVPGDEPTPTTVFGQAATVATEPGTPPLTTVTWGDAPMLSITGLDPEAFLEDADPAFATASSPGGVTELTIGELTAGWEVLAPPEPARLGSVSASLSVNDTSDVEGNLVEVSVDNPLIALATVAPLRPVDINGVDGWLSEAPGNWVTWQVDQSTYALVGGSVTAEESLELARSIEWVDVGTWMTTYGLQLPVFGPG